jgi:phage tail-like protein
MVAVTQQPATPRPGPQLALLPSGQDDILSQYLPGILRQDPFLASFLRIFDSVLRPLLEMIGAVDSYLDPALTPAGMVGWLATWVGEELAPAWPEEARRALAGEAVALHRERGTGAGLRRALQLVTGREPLVIENTPGLRLDADARLGINTSLESAAPHTIFVTLPGSAAETDLDAVGEVFRRMKPAHATYSVRTTEA